MATWQDIVTDALQELGVLNPADTASGDDAAFMLSKAKRLLDNWNAERGAVYADTIAEYRLTIGQNPHTIGPTGADFTVTQRPVRIMAANLVLSDGSRTPITVRDGQWWMRQAFPSQQSSIPTDLYYEAAWPNGKLWLSYEPSAAYDLELLTRALLSTTMALSDTFSLPPGYQDAITLTLAEDCAGAFQVPVPQALPYKAAEARTRIFGNNTTVYRLCTADSGLGGGRGSSFDYRTGQ